MTSSRIPTTHYQPDDKIYKKIKATLKCKPYNLPKDKCNSCNTEFHPDYLEEREPLNAVTDNLGRIWQRASIEIPCPNCGASVEHMLPLVSPKDKYIFFGDEAYRNEGKELITTISLVGVNVANLCALENRVNNLKEHHAPNFSPTDWVIHATEFRSPQKRKEHQVYSTWDEKKVQHFESDLFELIRTSGDHCLVVNASGIQHKSVKKGSRQQDELRNEVYNNMLMLLIDLAAENKVQPHFIFDAEKVVRDDTVIQGWARSEFLGAHKTLLYSHITKGIPIAEPEFVKPGSRPLLELADFVSYVVANYLYCITNKKTVRFDPANFGPMTYITFDRFGNPERTPSNNVGYPWEIHSR